MPRFIGKMLRELELGVRVFDVGEKVEEKASATQFRVAIKAKD
jgi:hypothetical protein